MPWIESGIDIGNLSQLWITCPNKLRQFKVDGISVFSKLGISQRSSIDGFDIPIHSRMLMPDIFNTFSREASENFVSLLRNSCQARMYAVPSLDDVSLALPLRRAWSLRKALMASVEFSDGRDWNIGLTRLTPNKYGGALLVVGKGRISGQKLETDDSINIFSLSITPQDPKS
nr:hypothetical protein Iba_chr05dCG0700 [Ipomoea batatas]